MFSGPYLAKEIFLKPYGPVNREKDVMGDNYSISSNSSPFSISSAIFANFANWQLKKYSTTPTNRIMIDKASMEFGYVVCEKSYSCLAKPELSFSIITEVTLKNMKITSKRIPKKNVNLHKNPVLKSL